MPTIEEMTRDEAVELVIIHSIACADQLTPGLVPQGIIIAWEPRVRRVLDKYREGGDPLSLALVEAIRLLSPIPRDEEILKDEKRSAFLG